MNRAKKQCINYPLRCLSILSLFVENLVKTMNLADRILGPCVINIKLVHCTNPLDYFVNILSNTSIEKGLAQVCLCKISIVFTSTS